MLTAGRLFRQRLRAEWAFHYQVWKLAVDWTVALYVLLPLAAFCVYQYATWWESLPRWTERVPVQAVAGLLFLFAWSGTIRLFLEEADQLFLLQRTAWVSTLVRRGIAYSLLVQLFGTLFVFTGLAPFLLFRYKLSLLQAAVWALLAWLVKADLAFLKQFLSVRYRSWRRTVWLGLLFGAGAALFAGGSWLLLRDPLVPVGICVGLGLLLAYLVNKRVAFKGSFYADVAREREARLKYAALLFRTSGITQHTPWDQRKKPILFRSSKPLFRRRTAVNQLTEAVIKSVLRNRIHLWNYGRMLSLFLFGSLLVPSGGRWLVGAGLALLLAFWAKSLWEEAEAHPYLRLFPWKPQDRWHAARKSILLLTLPGVVLLGMVAGFHAFSWPGVVGAIPFAGLASYLAANIALLSVRLGDRQ
ncbi:ABC transporter permease [Effusibacillus pohliae]|uniref:ABC transporter permease n=1 Tax=Effusibacillus pohliae TaxID=232270 RepID=UPI00036CB15F|nr:ABC transporter permease [Effusibacillus pohliae]